MKLTHNYTGRVREQSREMQGRDKRGKTLRQSAVTILQTGGMAHQLLEGTRGKNYDLETNQVEIQSHGNYQQNLWGGVQIKNGRLTNLTQNPLMNPLSGHSIIRFKNSQLLLEERTLLNQTYSKQISITGLKIAEILMVN